MDKQPKWSKDQLAQGRTRDEMQVSPSAQEFTLVAFQIDDMTCGHCASAITKAVHSVDAAAKVNIDLSSHRVEIHQTQATSLDLASAIVGAGFVPMQLDAAESEIPGPGAGCGGCGSGCR